MLGVKIVPSQELGANFTIEITEFCERYRPPDREPVVVIDLRLHFKDGTYSEVKDMEVSNLDRFPWMNSDYRIRFASKCSSAKISRTLNVQIREKLCVMSKSTRYCLDRTGIFKVDNKPVFCIGKEVICATTTDLHSRIELLPMKRELDIDNELSEMDAVAEILNLVGICPDPCRIIIAQILVYIMRQAYMDAGKSPTFSVFLYGSTGTQKTTLAGFLAQMYNRREGIIAPSRLNASVSAAVNMLMEANDGIVVLDDLFPAESGQIRRKQEETLIEIIRYIGDGTVPEKMEGKTRRTGHPRCGVLFTGEYLIGEGSDAARILPVEMTKIDGTKLEYFQNKPLIVSTFYYFFISWFVENYDSIVKLLKEWLGQYRKLNLGVHDRLRETHFFLNTAYILLLQYCHEKDILSEKMVMSFHEDFRKLLTELIKKQDQRVQKKIFVGQKNYLSYIRDAYMGKMLMIANAVDEFDEQIHEGVMHKNCLCLRGECLKKHFPQENLKDISKNLTANGALERGKKIASKQINALNGKRFYCIPVECLK